MTMPLIAVSLLAVAFSTSHAMPQTVIFAPSEAPKLISQAMEKHQPAAIISIQTRLADVIGPSNTINWQRVLNPQDRPAWFCWWMTIAVIGFLYMFSRGGDPYYILGLP